MKISGNISVAIFLILIIWGPVDHSWKYFNLIRYGYLIVIPYLIFFLLNFLFKKFKMSESVENKLERFFWTIVSLAILIYAYTQSQMSYHTENTKWIRTHDGMEAVGEDIAVKGTSWPYVIMLVFIAFLIFRQLVYLNKLKSNENKK